MSWLMLGRRNRVSQDDGGGGGSKSMSILGLFGQYSTNFPSDTLYYKSDADVNTNISLSPASPKGFTNAKDENTFYLYENIPPETVRAERDATGIDGLIFALSDDYSDGTGNLYSTTNSVQIDNVTDGAGHFLNLYGEQIRVTLDDGGTVFQETINYGSMSTSESPDLSAFGGTITVERNTGSWVTVYNSTITSNASNPSTFVVRRTSSGDTTASVTRFYTRRSDFFTTSY